jgi:hypothetical protein
VAFESDEITPGSGRPAISMWSCCRKPLSVQAYAALIAYLGQQCSLTLFRSRISHIAGLRHNNHRSADSLADKTGYQSVSLDADDQYINLQSRSGFRLDYDTV